jgi:hypothetical protein
MSPSTLTTITRSTEAPAVRASAGGGAAEVAARAQASAAKSSGKSEKIGRFIT